MELMVTYVMTVDSFFFGLILGTGRWSLHQIMDTSSKMGMFWDKINIHGWILLHGFLLLILSITLRVSTRQ